MPLYPDLAACGIHYMHFSVHVSGGLEAIEKFWEQRGLDRSEERLLFAGYSRQGYQHTAWIQWARSHEGCCDVFFGLDACSPTQAWPRRPLPKTRRLREADFRDFIAALGEMDVVSGVHARYAFPWDRSLDRMIKLPPGVRSRSLSLDVFDETQRRVMNVTYEKREKRWLAIVVPAGRFDFISDPDLFFKTPYDTACLLAKSLRQERLEPL